MNYKLLLVAIAGLSLSGCASILELDNVEKEFDCPVQDGFGCKSISSIRSLIVEGGVSQRSFTNYETHQVSVSGVPKWTPDVILKVHLGNYVDSHGDYHDDSVMYVVAHHGGWETK